ncbi:MAG: 6-phosphogluconolactonase, partial [Candidatus Peregrinibacteria bacterium]|nr:6-phosphogluconolactonase [Candidatus Peregrinibacteria bacterium]
MDIHHVNAQSDDEFIDEAVLTLTERLEQHIDEFGHAILGLSGGSTPAPIYTALGKQDLNWNNVSVFLVDERYIDPSHKDSNQNLIRNTLLAHATIPEAQLFFPDTTLDIEPCVVRYEQDLAELLSKGIPHTVTLGLGEDGHIASLFPPVPAEGYGDRLVMHTTTDTFAVHDRISTTMVVIGSADRKVFFLKGEGKKFVWEEMMHDDNAEIMME